LFEDSKPGTRGQNHFARYRQIAKVIDRYRLEEVLHYVGLRKFIPIFWILHIYPWHKMVYTKPERFRKAMEELGTTFVKIGQILSTRADLLPPTYIKELSKLQSGLQPLATEVMKNAIGDDLGVPSDKVFCSFNSEPIGVASIGQVYSCTLADGTPVVVKVRKPGVPELVGEDMHILRLAAESATKHWKGARQYDLIGIVQEFSEIIKAEMDYIQEGKNAEYFAWFFRDDRSVHIPRIFWESTTEGTITMERINGIGVLKTEELDKAGFDRKELAKRSVDLWLKMIFEGEAFHADPHPGNLFVEPDGRLALIDFGMVSIVDDEVRWQLVNVIKAIVDKNVDLLIDSLIELGAVSMRHKDSRASLRKDLKYVMRQLMTIQLEKHSDSVINNLNMLFTVLRQNQVQLPSSTFLLLKTLAMVQSLGRGLDPDFDILPMLEDRVKQMYKKRYSVSSALRRLPSAATELASLAGSLPQRLDRMMKTLERGEIQINADVSGVERHIHHLEQILSRTIIGFLIGVIIIGLGLLFVGLRLGN
jgi:ubiquinone biosynthesis protein